MLRNDRMEILKTERKTKVLVISQNLLEDKEINKNIFFEMLNLGIMNHFNEMISLVALDEVLLTNMIIKILKFTVNDNYRICQDSIETENISSLAVKHC